MNKFVYLALQHTIALAIESNGVDAVRERLAKGLDITVVGDNDFYSQRAMVCCITSPPLQSCTTFV